MPTDTETVRIYGASDDLIEARGAVDEEYGAPHGKPALIRIHATTDRGPDLVLLRAEWDPDGTGEWRLTDIESTDGLVTITPARGEDAGNDADGCPGYSDKATIRGGHTVEVEELTWHYEPNVLSWDWKAQPDLDALAALLDPLGVTLTRIDTGGDDYAVRITKKED